MTRNSGFQKCSEEYSAKKECIKVAARLLKMNHKKCKNKYDSSFDFVCAFVKI